MGITALFLAYKDCERPERLKTVAALAIAKKRKDDLRRQGRDTGQDPRIRPDDPVSLHSYTLLEAEEADATFSTFADS